MVEVFKTDVEDQQQARNLLMDLAVPFPHLKINIDLDDCDKILRVEGEVVLQNEIIGVVCRKGFRCKALE